MKPLVTKLEFWAGDSPKCLDQFVLCPQGYHLPVAGEFIILPVGEGILKLKCLAVTHQFNFQEEAEISGVLVSLFVVRCHVLILEG